MSQPYPVKFLPVAIKDLSKLDKPIAKLLLSEIEWLSVHASKIKHRPLRHNLQGKFKLRVGDWRVVYEILSSPEKTIIIHFAGHRREVYD